MSSTAITAFITAAVIAGIPALFIFVITVVPTFVKEQLIARGVISAFYVEKKRK
jgi:hypothetical protein